MASIIRRPTSKIWCASFRNSAGKQIRKSTGETDRKKAMAIANKLEAIAQRKDPRSKLRSMLTDFINEVYGEEIITKSVKDFVGEWLAMKKPEVAPGTLGSYRSAANKLLVHLGDVANADIAAVTKAHLLGFRNELAAKFRAPSVNHDLAIIGLIFRSAKENGYLLDDPKEFIRPVRSDRDESGRRAFTIQEIRSILAVADDEWRSIIKFGLYTGQRLTDIISLTWSNIDLEHNVIRFIARKTSKPITIPIADALLTHILTLPAGDTVPSKPVPLHPRALRRINSERNPGRISTGRISDEFGALLVAAGLRKPVKYQKYRTGPIARKNLNELSFHSLRHTAVSLLKEAGIPQAVVQELIGHSSQRMSALYTHVGSEALQRAAAALPDVT